MSNTRLTLADFELMDDPSLKRSESILDVGFSKLYSQLERAKKTHVETADGHSLLFLRLPSKSQMVFLLRDDVPLYNSCAGYDWFPDMAMDYEDFVEKLDDAGIRMGHPMVVGYVLFLDADNDDDLSEVLLDTLEAVILPRIKWFVPHTQMHKSLNGRGFAGILYSRFLAQGGVGFVTTTHTSDAARLWASVAKHTGVSIIHAERKGKKFSLADGSHLGYNSAKILLPKSRFAAAVESLKSSGRFV